MPSLEEAIEQKYGEGEDDFSGAAVHIYVPKVNARNLIPSLLVLNDCNIDAAGTEALKSKCQDVLELDLAQNRLNDWGHVRSILESMPRLNFVNLSFNNLQNDMPNLDKDYPLLKNLVLNSTHLNWQSVQRLLKGLSNLEELHLSFNDFHNVDLCEGCEEEKNRIKHTKLKKLHFTGNPIHTWNEVSKLGQSFPSLEYLVLAECPLQSLDPADTKEADAVAGASLQRSESECESGENKEMTSAHHFFRNVKFLNLNYTCLSSWDDIDRLGRFPALQSLRIQGCPLIESSPYTEHERRQLLIARLGNVYTLNGGGAISADEREDAERAFIRYYMDRPESDRPDRYSDLKAVHGRLDPLVNIDLSPEKRVTVSFTCRDVSETRTLLVYQTVAELKQKLDGFRGIPARRMRLFYVDQGLKEFTGPEEMRFPNKQLYSYNISNGDEIIVDAKLGTFKSVP